MGERSQVTASFDRTGFNIFCNECDKLNPEFKKQVFDLMKDSDEFYWNNADGITIKWDYVKWYAADNIKDLSELTGYARNYADVTFFDMLFHQLEKTNQNDFSFTRYDYECEEEYEYFLGTMDSVMTEHLSVFPLPQVDNPEKTEKLFAGNDYEKLKTKDFVRELIDYRQILREQKTQEMKLK